MTTPETAAKAYAYQDRRLCAVGALALYSHTAEDSLFNEDTFHTLAVLQPDLDVMEQYLDALANGKDLKLEDPGEANFPRLLAPADLDPEAYCEHCGVRFRDQATLTACIVLGVTYPDGAQEVSHIIVSRKDAIEPDDVFITGKVMPEGAHSWTARVFGESPADAERKALAMAVEEEGKEAQASVCDPILSDD